MTDRDRLAARFEAQRGRLGAIAHRLVGAEQAEDVVQEAWLRLERTDVAAIDNLDAWLTTVVSRIALHVLRSAPRRWERPWQVQPWEEPVSREGQPEREVAERDAVGAALLVVLDRLNPAERLAFVLHDVFGRPFDEIAGVLGRSAAAARQLASRGRRKVRGAPAPTSQDRRRARQVVEAWLLAVQRGDLGDLLALLDEDVVLRADYGSRGGEVVAGARALADRAATFARVAAGSVPVLVDGRPGVMAVRDGRVLSLMAFEITDGRITALDVLADPARLAGLDPAG